MCLCFTFLIYKNQGRGGSKASTSPLALLLPVTYRKEEPNIWGHLQCICGDISWEVLLYLKTGIPGKS